MNYIVLLRYKVNTNATQMQYIIMMTKDEKNELKKKLPTKWVTDLAISTGFSKAYVMRVMSGKATHVGIEKQALKLALKHRREINDVERLKNTVL